MATAAAAERSSCRSHAHLHLPARSPTRENALTLNVLSRPGGQEALAPAGPASSGFGRTNLVSGREGPTSPLAQPTSLDKPSLAAHSCHSLSSSQITATCHSRAQHTLCNQLIELGWCVCVCERCEAAGCHDNNLLPFQSHLSNQRAGGGEASGFSAEFNWPMPEHVTFD